MRGEGDKERGEHWRYKFDSSIYLREDWKGSIYEPIIFAGVHISINNICCSEFECTYSQSVNLCLTCIAGNTS